MAAKPQQDEFAQLVTRALIEQGALIGYNQQEFSLSVKDLSGKETTEQIFLSNYFNDYCSAGNDDERDRVIARIVNHRTLDALLPDTYEEAKHRIYPHVQDFWTVNEMRLLLSLGRIGRPSDEDLVFAWFLFADCFAAVLAYDLPTTRIIINMTHCRRWNVGYEQMFKEAEARLLQRSTGEFIPIYDNGGKVYLSKWQDGYDASRILLNGLDSLDVRGSHVTFLPNADRLIVTGSQDDIGLAYGLAAIEGAQAENKPLPPVPIEIVGLDRRPFVLPQSHPLYERFKRLELRYFNSVYDRQKVYLKELYANYYVARFYAEIDREGRASSRCTLTDGVPTLLPKTDMITFMGGVDPDNLTLVAFGSWDRVVAVVPDLFEEMEWYPPRFRIKSFPTGEQLKIIGNEL